MAGFWRRRWVMKLERWIGEMCSGVRLLRGDGSVKVMVRRRFDKPDVPM